MAKAEQAKAKFPTKPCPKCHKPIHARSKSHEACGWVDSSPAVSKPSVMPAPANGKALSKMEAVRRVLGEHGKDTMPIQIQDYLKKQYSIKMEPSVISNYKSTILNQKSAKKIGRPKGSKSIKIVHTGGSSGITLEDIRAVKQLADKIGAEKVSELAGVLAK